MSNSTTGETMHITIPGNTTWEPADNALFEWFRDNKIDPAMVNGLHPVLITDAEISGTGLLSPFTMPVIVPMNDYLAAHLLNRFGETSTGPAVLDDMAALIEQLREARAAEKAAKDRADEARDQILARLRTEQAEIGTVNGAPAVKWEIRKVNRFQTAAFRKAHPDLADEFTKESEENRLNLL